MHVAPLTALQRQGGSRFVPFSACLRLSVQALRLELATERRASRIHLSASPRRTSMIALLSPAKRLNEKALTRALPVTVPALMPDIQELMAAAQTLDKSDVQELMDVSDNIAELTWGRFQAMKTPFTVDNATPAALLFDGDSYRGLRADTLSDDELVYAQSHLRILSGLYGVLRPLDLIQPYRLEMGRKLGTSRGKNLYDFWGERLAEELNRAVADSNDKTIVHLASNEYFKAVPIEALDARVVTCTFREQRDGELKFISFSAKEARGMMARYIVQSRPTSVDDLQAFCEAAYRYRADLSTPDELVFVRPDQRR